MCEGNIESEEKTIPIAKIQTKIRTMDYILRMMENRKSERDSNRDKEIDK